MGALGVMGVPLCNGYISKTLIHESIVEEIAFYQKQDKSITQNESNRVFIFICRWFNHCLYDKIICCCVCRAAR